MRQLVHICFAGILLLNLTGLFRFFAPQLGIDIGTVSQVLLVIQLGYLALHPKTTIDILRSRVVWLWILFIIAWPYVTTVYTPSVIVREHGLQFYYATLFLASAVFVARVRWGGMRTLISVAIGLTISGLVLSLFAPEYFADVNAMLRGGREEYISNRAFGFFMQPNRASVGVILLFLLWLAGDESTGKRGQLTAVLLMLSGVGLTTSRSGIAIALFIAGLVFWSKHKHGQASGSFFERPLPLFMSVVRFGTAVALAFVLVLSGNSLLQESEVGGLSDKLFFWVKVETFDQIWDDESMESRLHAQKTYGTLIAERPIRGYGIGAVSTFRELGVLNKSSHNLYVERVFEYGILYVLFFVFILYRIATHSRRSFLIDRLGWNVPLVWVSFVLATGMTTSSLLDTRIFYCTLGFVVAGLTYPGILRTVGPPGRPREGRSNGFRQKRKPSI